jgi:Flp pilus assembly protein TadG
MLFQRLLHDRTAGVAPLLGLCIIPLVGAIGAAVDYSRAASVRTSMQMALDSTALMLSKEAQGLDGSQLGTKAAAYFTALFLRPEATAVQITQEFSSPALSTFSLKITGKPPCRPSSGVCWAKITWTSRPRARCSGASRSSTCRWRSTIPAR